MALFMLIFFSLLSLILLIGGISMMSSDEETGGKMIFFSLLCGLVIWLSIDGIPYKDGDPVPVDKGLISVMCDDKVAIVRIGEEYQHTYISKEDYDALLSNEYEVMMVIRYDMIGEELDRVYTLKVD